MQNVSKIALVMGAFLMQTGCSVYKSSMNEGVHPDDFRGCLTKANLLSSGLTFVEGHYDDKGNYVENYRGRERDSSSHYLRAAGHGLLDVMTLGLWEVAGTPIEGAIENNRGFLTVSATFSRKDASRVQKLEIFNRYGQKIYSQSAF